MDTAKYIGDLLYRYQCVVVPSFGAFLTQIKPAYLQADSNTFYPPSKTVSFNSQLKSNDGLLVSHIAQLENKSFEEVLETIEKQASGWSRTLRREGILHMEPVGTFRRNSEGKLLFEPEEKTNFLTAAFGLSAVHANPVTREILKEEVAELEQRIPFSFTPERKESFGLSPYLKYAAIILLSLTTGITAFSLNKTYKERDAIARVEAQQEVSKKIQEATFFGSQPLELPSLTLEVSKLEETKPNEIKRVRGSHHIIAGAFRIRENADKKIRQLQRKGFEAHYLGVNAYGLHQVAYGSYTNSQVALEELRKIKQTVSSDAWLLSIR